MMRPLAIDLCCGMGGFTQGLLNAGYDVVGFDVLALPGYPGRLVLQDVRTLCGKRFRGATLIVAAPPCQEFSRHDMPWPRAKNPPPPDMSIWNACIRIAREAGLPLVIENVRGAQKFMGKCVRKVGGRHFWGDVPPFILECEHKNATYYPPNPNGLRPWIRSRIQPEIGEAIGRHFLGETHCNIGLFA